ncbi:methionine--tRNA ligase subunit beta [Candidatus Roizmanbacteria bacterium]|nr:methionine--tRNA ligase subunit beta [Candidatus Roizmanbacteria bacterium]
MIITHDEFDKVDIRMGKVVVCESVEGSEKLLRLQVDFGEEVGERQILSGIAKYYKPEEVVGKTLPFVINLESRKMMGLESQGMLVAVNAQGQPVLLQPDKEIPLGSKIC